MWQSCRHLERILDGVGKHSFWTLSREQEAALASFLRTGIAGKPNKSGKNIHSALAFTVKTSVSPVFI